MKTGGGDFSAEAYEQMRNAYDKQQQRQIDDEVKGTQLMGVEYGLETLPVDSPWKDKIENWEYPNGKGQYLDEKQDPNEVLQVMRDAAQARIDARNVEEDVEIDDVEEVLDEEDLNITQMSDEEFDAYIASILEDDEEEENEEEEVEDDLENENEEEEAGDDDEEDEEEPQKAEDVSEADEEGDDTEAEDEAEEDTEEVESDEDDYDPEDIAAQIAELRAEIETMQFVPTQEDDESE